jgi:hypothetical protein
MNYDLTGVYIPNYLKSEDTGWLNPNGDFYQCDYTWHLDTAYKLFGTYDTEMLAKQGVVHVFWNTIKNYIDYYAAIPLTEAQINWLESHNIEIYEEDRGRI